MSALITLNKKTNPISLESRRYIGNKTKLNEWIFENISKETKGCKSFLDIFAGTGTVAKTALKHFDHIMVNDILHSNHTIYYAFFSKDKWRKKLVEQKIAEYNLLKSKDLKENYFSENFGGKFFDHDTAKLIGYIREDIEENKETLSKKEYHILIATLIYNIDKIANTVGHFDAYIKKPIKQQNIELRIIETLDTEAFAIYREDANILASKVKADVVYIDPPYNSRQYSRFYHIYENLVKWEKPELFGVALKPEPENMSDYCTVKAKDTLQDLVTKLDAKYLVVSYNNTYNSKSHSSENKIKLEEILEILNAKGETKVFEASHKYFNAGKTDFNDHKEFLFITKVTKKNDQKKLNRSPLFYVGDKFKILSQIQDYFPKDINNLIEPFVGGGSVFLNTKAKNYYLNDIDSWVYKLHNYLIKSSTNEKRFFKELESIILNYGLSRSYKEDVIPKNLKIEHKKTYFAKFNQKAFLQLRNDFNSNKSSLMLFYVLLIYGFNRMIRFNSKGDYNLPVGNVDLNNNVVLALKDYFAFIKQKNINLYNLDYKDFIKKIKINKKDFIYLDPPYLITFSEYNKLWTEKEESELLSLLDEFDRKGYRFAISNVTHYKGKENKLLIEWSKKYKTHEIKSNYISYHDNSVKSFREVIIKNYV
jgi:adenine-specific DNA-methyltransferase